jgi:hypothetical protein
VGLFDGQIASAIYAGFKGKTLVCALRTTRVASSGGLDALGDPLALSPTTYPCEGFDDAYSDAYKLAAGIPLTDVKVNIFAKSLPDGVRPGKDDIASVTRAGVVSWFQLRKADIDPAGALWVCQAYKIAAPSDA